MLWYKLLQNTICCGTLGFTSYWLYGIERVFSNAVGVPQMRKCWKEG